LSLILLGKSSLLQLLFRLRDYSGRILIDGKDISTVPLAALRRSIAVIPQAPVLFSGTIRSNLDPFGRCSDEILWRTLESIDFHRKIASFSAGLGQEISETVELFSLGEKQLLTFARALLQDCRIICLDESSAMIDKGNEQKLIDCVEKLHKTVILIAHRIETVMRMKKIVVLDGGMVLEYDSRENLLADHNSRFKFMVEQAEIGPINQ
jgi:ATP-binding cassette subfamily C (CFTR/MRP) protein 1